MDGENLCYTTVLDASLANEYEHTEFTVWEPYKKAQPGDDTPGTLLSTLIAQSNTHFCVDRNKDIYFVHPSHRRSLLVAILEDLREMRDRTSRKIDYEDRDSPSDYGQDALNELGSWTPRDIKDTPENWKLARRCAALEVRT